MKQKQKLGPEHITIQNKKTAFQNLPFPHNWGWKISDLKYYITVCINETSLSTVFSTIVFSIAAFSTTAFSTTVFSKIILLQYLVLKYLVLQ